MHVSFLKTSFALFLALLLCRYLPDILEPLLANVYAGNSKNLSQWLSIAIAFCLFMSFYVYLYNRDRVADGREEPNKE